MRWMCILMWVWFVIVIGGLLFSLIGKDKWGFGFGGTGKKSNANQFDEYGEVSELCGWTRLIHHNYSSTS